jgi:penicillin amidase
MIHPILKWLFVQYNKRPLKKKYFHGSISIKGIKNEISVIRDTWGIPHIKAETIEELIFAQGWVHAQDRFWQMELNRRTGQGKLAEAFGKAALDTDRLTRTLGFNRLAQEDYNLMDDVNKNLLHQYTNGINSWLTSSKLPIEFLLTKIKPEPWTPIDSLAFGRVMTWTLSHGWSGSLTRQDIIEKVGIEMAEELAIYYPEDNPVELPEGLSINLNVDKMVESATGPFLNKDLEGGGRGSNAWVVTGKLTDTGRPVLCNDTHLKLSTPGVWYINYLKSNDGYNATGASLAGIPGVMLGHNEFTSWGMTLAFTDVEDIFIEKVDVTDKEKYEYKGESISLESFEEIISVKGKPDHVENVRKTIHGPLIGGVTGREKFALSLSSKSLQPNQIVRGFMEISQSKNWDEFVIGVKRIEAPQLNIVYADVKGNIGLAVTGNIPIRNKGNGQLPVPGWSGEFDWGVDIPLDEMPKVLNPKEGYVISTNNAIADDSYPYFLGNSFMNGYRAKRVKSVFESSKPITQDICKSLHGDVYSIPGQEFVEGLIKGFRTAKPKAQKMIDILSDWNYVLDTDSVGGTVYQVVIYFLVRNIVEPKLGKELTDKYLGVGEHPLLLPVSELLGHTTPALFRMVQNTNSKWIKSDKELFSLIENSLNQTCNWLEKRFGIDSENWNWGEIHQAQFRHSLSIQPPMDKIFDIGPYPIGGDTDTVCQTAFNPSSPYHPTEWCPSIRFIIDVGNWENSHIICPPGISGILGSKHYDDLANLWIKNEYIPLKWNWKNIEKNGRNHLKLVPQG